MRMLVNQQKYFPKTTGTVGDLLVLVTALLLGVTLLFLPQNERGTTAIVTWERGETTLPLDTPTILALDSHGVHLTLVVADGGISVEASTCPDGLCVSAGSIDTAGDMLVCVPAGVVVRIPQDRDTGEDFIIG